MKSKLIELVRRNHARFPIISDILVTIVIIGSVVISMLPAKRKVPHRRTIRKQVHTFFAQIIAGRLEILLPNLRRRPPGDRFKRRVRLLLYLTGSHYMMTGDLALAARCLEAALQLTVLASKEGVHHYRVLGAAYFMLGELEKAHHAFLCAGNGRRYILSGGVGGSSIRYLGPGWFVAIGHSAMLDFYFKKRLLGWSDRDTEVLLATGLDTVPGRFFVLQYRQYGLRVTSPVTLSRAYNFSRRSDELNWNALSEDYRFAAMDDFWEQEFPDGTILTYTHAAARIQQEWESERRPPLLSINNEGRELLRKALRAMDVPEGAWFVCLHVREAGFHAEWNAIYPTVRDADIDDYELAIRAITERGGYVIRVGDPSMKPMPAMAGVFDYAHSNLKNPVIDVLLPAGCRFFIGTNSGYATVPGIYGVPNVLTNWVPVALPLWFGQDLMIPKVMFDRDRKTFVDFERMFSTRLGAWQNIEDFPGHIEVRPNTPEEIREVVVEMLDRLDNRASYVDHDHALQNRYHEIAEEHGSYKGSRIGRDFLRKYEDLVWGKERALALQEESTAHEDPANGRTAVSVAP
jgi:putative glycosyltransferase (TIGR04372 family)